MNMIRLFIRLIVQNSFLRINSKEKQYDIELGKL